MEISDRQSSKTDSQPSVVGNVVENEYTMMISNRPKLYDLNKNFTNFDIEFQIDAEKPDLRFYVHILPQDQLDKTDLNEVEMKLVQGRISGKVSNGNNVYQNYFIIIKSATEEEAKVVIRTRTQVFPVASTPPPPPPSSQVVEEEYQASDEVSTAPGVLSYLHNPKVRYAVMIVAVLLVMAAGYYYYYYYRHDHRHDYRHDYRHDQRKQVEFVSTTKVPELQPMVGVSEDINAMMDQPMSESSSDSDVFETRSDSSARVRNAVRDLVSPNVI